MVSDTAAATAAVQNGGDAPQQAPAVKTDVAARSDVISAPVAKASAGPATPGEVAERVLPQVSQSAQDSIRGTVRVIVGLDIDSSGAVQNAELVSAGPSKYFSRMALQAAQRWKFHPPTVAGRSVLSRWNLRFDFTSDGPSVTPAQQDVP